MIEIENFFPIHYQQELLKLVKARRFNWHYRPKLKFDNFIELKKIFNNDDNIINHEGFSHTFFKKDKVTCKSFLNKKNLLELFINYTKNNFNITVKDPLRLSCMFSLPTDSYKGNNYLMPHIDYFMPHYTLLYYVNTVDGDTVIFNDKIELEENHSHLKYEQTLKLIDNCNTKNIRKRITPIQGKAVLFDGLCLHSGNIPKISERFVINFNFT